MNSAGLIATLRRWYEIKGWPHLRDAADTIERLEAENAEVRERLRLAQGESGGMLNGDQS